MNLGPIFTNLELSSSARKNLLKESKKKIRLKLLMLATQVMTAKACGSQNSKRFSTMHAMLVSGLRIISRSFY
jgi:hypothetical protein